MNDITFEGLEEIDKRLAKMLSPEQIEAALMRACLVVERSAKQKAQVGRGTGDLARSIKSDVINLEGIVHTPLEYAPYVEYGNQAHTTGKNHFIKDASANHGDQYKKIMEAALKAQ